MARREFIGFKVSEYENEIIRGKANRVNTNVSAYVRTASLNKEIIVIEGLKEIIRELNAIGNNLNQATILLRMGKIKNPDLAVVYKLKIQKPSTLLN